MTFRAPTLPPQIYPTMMNTKITPFTRKTITSTFNYYKIYLLKKLKAKSAWYHPFIRILHTCLPCLQLAQRKTRNSRKSRAPMKLYRISSPLRLNHRLQHLQLRKRRFFESCQRKNISTNSKSKMIEHGIFNLFHGVLRFMAYLNNSDQISWTSFMNLGWFQRRII